LASFVPPLREVFEVHVSSHANDIQAFLPITPYQLLDMLEQLWLQPDESPSVDIHECIDPFEFLDFVMSYDYTLIELNALAVRLSLLDETGLLAFHGLVKTENDKTKGSIPIRKLVDLASSIDFQMSGLNQVSQTLDLKPHKPEYTILLEVTQAGRAAYAADLPPGTACYPTSADRSEADAEIRKIYDLSPEESPAGIVRSDFEQDGFRYTLTDLLKQEAPEYEERFHTETVSVPSRDKDMESVLALLPAQREFVTELSGHRLADGERRAFYRLGLLLRLRHQQLCQKLYSHR